MIGAKKIISACLCLFICIGMALSLLLTSGVRVGAADYSNELWLVDDVNYALLRGKRIHLSDTQDLSPYRVDSGTMYLPVSVICDYMDAMYSVSGNEVTISLSSGKKATLTVGSTSWMLGSVAMEDFLIPVAERYGVPFISILMANDIFGTYSYYDKAMGLLILSTDKISGYNSSYSSMAQQIKVLSALIMDRPTGQQVYNDLAAYAGVETHPRLLVGQDKFGVLKEAFYSENSSDAYAKGVRAQYMKGATAFDAYFTVNSYGETVWKSEETRRSVRQPYYLYDENGNRLINVTSYTYFDTVQGKEVTLTLPQGCSGDGYDVGGRSNVETYTSKLQYLAFAWQMTGEDKFADAFYLLAIELDKWEHWGEGHFLNVADGSYAYAVGFDWIYHAFDNQESKRIQLADILYRKGLMKGYYSIKYDGKGALIQDYCDFSISKRAGASGAWRTVNRTNNWQTVCGGGMIAAALVLAEYGEYKSDCLYVIENYVKSFEKCLLQFLPDGSYPESASYWAYCVNTLMKTLVAFEESCGRSYGYKDVVGLYESYYYAAGICDSDFTVWGYHDSSKSTLDATTFYMASKVFDDKNLAAFRNKMIFSSKTSMSLTDVLFYDPSFTSTEYDIPLDYNFAGIHTATFRSSLESGATYTGLHVGPTVHDHSDFDTGNFILRMGGIDWCGDPGSEDYNVPGFWNTSQGGTRFRLYRKSLEGHSTIVIRSDELVHGQKHVQFKGTFPVINTFYSDEYGGYAVSNMRSQYGSTCSGAYRGVLMTNSRRTVVLQDEISFSTPTSLTWVLNLAGMISVSDDGKSLTSTSYINGKNIVLRLTMLTDDDSLRFRRLGSQETVLKNTITKTNSGESLACDPEQRVVIEANDVTDFNVAVVFDLLGHVDEAVGYSYVPMAQWQTSDDGWLNDANSDIVYPTPKPQYKYPASAFAKAIRDLENAKGDMAKIAEILARTAEYLTDCDRENPTVASLIEEYMIFVNRYNYEVQRINSQFLDIYFGSLPSSAL